ncbi:MAG: carboxypeptidase regulatory-like domain-containing protein, partial [Saprospiraceae bacterium]|nr:carboxypeptidase regulatory-like domain-containing protein [Saprospiraceae bacterium]
MKLSLFLSSLWLFLASLFAPTEPTTFLTGLVTDGTEPLIGATIKVMKGTSFVRGTVTDYNGEYRINLEPGTYDLEINYTGFSTVKITGVKVLSGVTTRQDITMSNASVLEEVVIKERKVPQIEKDQTSSGQTLTSEQIKNLPTRSVEKIKETTVGAEGKKSRDKLERSEGPKGKAKAKAMSPAPVVKPEVATTVGAVSTDGGDVNIKGSRGEVADYYIDGIRVRGGIPPVEDISYDGLSRPVDVKLDMTLTTEEPAMAAGLIHQPAPRAGLLTAGEWNDLHNWNHHWLDILADGEADSYQLMYQFYPKQRYAILVTN